MEFAIVDIETTGSHHSNDCITEIGIVISNGKNIVDTYETLINPNEKIGWYVSKLTGITDAMVATAPQFNDVAEKIFSMLHQRIFVAHNVNFDYNIVKIALEKSGYTIPTKRLCSLRLSRAIYPGFQSYGLGNITKALGIKLENAHRAMGDAMATAHLFHQMYEKNAAEITSALKGVAKEATIPPNLNRKLIDTLPEAAGVYYFYNSKGKVIYIGKAKNIKKRVITHFSGKNNIAKRGLIENIFDLSFTLTGNEVIAALLEENEIKNYWPEFNKAQKNKENTYGLYKYTDNIGVTRLAINKIAHQNIGLIQFPTLASARNWLLKKIESFELKPAYCGFLAHDNGSINDETHEHNIKKFLKLYLLNEASIVWYGTGRTPGETAFALMEEGVYLGFGFVENSVGYTDLEELKNYITRCKDTYQSRKILGSTKINILNKHYIISQNNNSKTP